jgi:NodT family efflux transporter outer membrane factor (OMF) lipoprotein
MSAGNNVKRRWLAFFASSLLSVACAVGPNFHRPAAPGDRGYTPDPVKETALADGKVQRFVEGQSIAADWWQILHCAELDLVLGQALAHNPGLDAARATLRQNQDSLRAGYGVFLPQVDAHAGVSRQVYNPAPGVLPGSSPFTLFSLSGTVSYALDIWGGSRRQLEMLGAAVDAQRYTLAGAYVMLTSNVIDAVIAQAAYRAEIDATKATVGLLDEQIRIANAQVIGGTVPLSNVLSLQSQRASIAATLPPLEQKIDQATDLLAALSGTTPANSGQSPRLGLSDFRLPGDLPLTLPSQLVRQRPDVLVAEAELHAANANIGVATAAMLPSFTLSAGYGVNNTAPGNLFGSQSPFWSVGGGLTQPILEEGALNYQRKAAIEGRDAAAALYRQTVLAAFEQVADTLRGLSHDADTLVAQTEAVETAEGAMRLIHANYQGGIATYLQVLTADVQYLQAKIGYVQAVAQRLQDTVVLYVALGGGWWNAQKVIASGPSKAETPRP